MLASTVLTHGPGEYLTVAALVLTLMGLILAGVARSYTWRNELRRELEKQIQANRDKAEEAQKLLEARCGDRASALHVRLNDTRETYVLKSDLNRQLDGLGQQLTAIRMEMQSGFKGIDREMKAMPEKVLAIAGQRCRNADFKPGGGGG